MPELSSYLVDSCTMPFCKGCGHSHVIRQLNEALVKLAVQPPDVCLVTDIGCIGLADSLFRSVHTVHTTHGRSSAFAAGIQIADSILSDGKVKTIVLIGDGGAMIGLQHLVNAALMNINVTVILCNNFLFGMTGGQNSAFSPFNFLTPTTPHGNIVPPLDICNVMTACGAGCVSRELATDKSLSSMIASAVNHKGFALLEVVELCTEHATEKNALTGKSLSRLLESQGQKLGTLVNDFSRTEFSSRYKDKYPQSARIPDERYIAPSIQSRLEYQVGIVIAGSAGERVQSSARKLCEEAMTAGLYCSQKNDNPVTQGSGFSISEVIISPEEILYTGIEIPDVVIAVSQEGMDELVEKGTISRLVESTEMIVDSEVVFPPTAARIHRSSFRKEDGPDQAASAAIRFYVQLSGIFHQEKVHS